jgi:hypothetical protein
VSAVTQALFVTGSGIARVIHLAVPLAGNDSALLKYVAAMAADHVIGFTVCGTGGGDTGSLHHTPVPRSGKNGLFRDRNVTSAAMCPIRKAVSLTFGGVSHVHHLGVF